MLKRWIVHWIVMLAVIGAAIGPWAAAEEGTPPAAGSALASSLSPYLRLHADDPVAWREWDPGLLAEARQRNLPLFISSGYYACHWCHVMHQESFLDAAIAERLNRDFIPVKLDREMHTALDDFLLEFVRALQGVAGWPLNVVVLPTGDVLAGVIYAPRDDFEDFLQRITTQLATDEATWFALARTARDELLQRQRDGELVLSAERAGRLPERLAQRWHAQADVLAGGFGDQAKFPHAPWLEALLTARIHGLGLADWDDFLALTLDEMARAGLRDVLGGGFFRYSETPDWGVPHFEIMLEDQAQLARLYLRAARHYGRPDWAMLGLETLMFVLRDMRREQDGWLVSALSAVDAQGVEGGRYLWSADQLDQALADVAHPVWVRHYFGLSGAPRFTQGHLPKQQQDWDAIAAQSGLTRAEVVRAVAQAAQALGEQRTSRRVSRDEKPLTGAHGLLLAAFAEAVIVIRDGISQDAGVWRPGQGAKADPAGERHSFQSAALGAWWLDQGVESAEIKTAAFDLATDLARAADPAALAVVLDADPDRAGAADLADWVYLAWGLQQWQQQVSGVEHDAQVQALLESIWDRFAEADGWRTAEEKPFPGMVAQRFLPERHRPSPSTLLQSLTQAYRSQSASLEAHWQAWDWRPTLRVERDPLAHAGLVILGSLDNGSRPIFLPQ